MSYCVRWDGSKLPDNVVRNIVLYSKDEEYAYQVLCEYVLGRRLDMLHYNIIHQNVNYKNTLHLAPRGHGKSTIGDVDYCIFRILRNPNIRIMIGSKTQTQAEAFLGEVKAHLEMNDTFIRVFGNLRSNNWNNKEFTVNTRNIIKKEATLTALGASGAVVSKHFDMIIADDLVGFENARTETQRTKLKEWFYSSLKPTLEPWGELHVLGTRYHPLDLYEDFINSGNYHVFKQSAICDKSMPNYEFWKELGMIPEEEGGEFSLWSNVYSLDTLRDIRKESGSIIFAMQYQNDTELAKGNIFKPNYFKYFESYEVDYDRDKVYVHVVDEKGRDVREVTVYMGVDLAISEKESADYFVIFVIGKDEEGNIYCLDYLKDRMSFDRQLNAIIRYGEQKFPMVRRIGIESVAYQRAMADELKRTTQLPIKTIQTKVDKVTRAMRRSALFENGKVYLREDMLEFEEMLLLFPEVEHDDLFDGWEFAVTMADKRNEVRVRDRRGFYI